MEDGPRPTVAVGAVCRDDAGRLLVVRRGRAPARGRWAVPGGRVEPGEALTEAVAREVAEEAGIEVEVHGLVGVFEVRDEEHHLVILDFHATRTGGELRAGDDADEVAWMSRSELERAGTTDGLLGFLDTHGVELAP